MELMERLGGVFREVFEDDELRISRETTANDVPGWDSLSHVNLILAIETEFNIRFTHKELLAFRNVGDMLDCIRGKTDPAR